MVENEVVNPVTFLGKQKLTEVFDACLTFILPKDFNTVVACVPYGHGLFNNERRDRMLDDRFEQVKETLGLYDVLKEVELV
ncbi:hypothetical protein AAVH_06480 [Aphelenchoides avenae]|nr:hypothetical protein AAVH_06480 [Aphelenchus avenae]